MDDIYKKLGVISLAVITVYFFYKILEINTSIMEGFANKKGKKSNNYKNYVKETRDSMKKKTEQLRDTLLIGKYKHEYEDIVLELEDYLNLSMLEAVNILSSTKKEQFNKDDIELIKNINQVNEFRKTLDDIMTFIDKQK